MKDLHNVVSSLMSTANFNETGKQGPKEEEWTLFWTYNTPDLELAEKEIAHSVFKIIPGSEYNYIFISH